MNPGEVTDRLAELQRQFQSRMPQRLREIRELWCCASSQESADAELIAQLHRKVHSLNGSAGAFGAGAVSVAARQLEDLLPQAGLSDWTLVSEEISTRIAALESAAAYCQRDVPAATTRCRVGEDQEPTRAAVPADDDPTSLPDA